MRRHSSSLLSLSLFPPQRSSLLLPLRRTAHVSSAYFSPSSASPPQPPNRPDTNPSEEAGDKVVYEFAGKQYTDYHKLLDDYTEHMENYAELSDEVVSRMRRKMKENEGKLEEASHFVNREYIATFLPLMIVLFFYMEDQNNRIGAQLAHASLKEKAKKNTRTPWVKV